MLPMPNTATKEREGEAYTQQHCLLDVSQWYSLAKASFAPSWHKESDHLYKDVASPLFSDAVLYQLFWLWLKTLNPEYRLRMVN